MSTGNIDSLLFTKSFGTRRIWSGTNDKNHRRDNAYTAYGATFSQKPCSRIAYFQETWGQCSPFQISVVPYYPETQDAGLRALAKCRESIQTHDFNAGVFLSQGKQAAEQILNSAKACLSLLAAIRKLDAAGIASAIARAPGQENRPLRRPARKALKRGDVSAVWLAMQYGWLPLISDLADAIEAWKARSVLPRTVKVKGKAKTSPYFVELRSSGASCPGWCTEYVTYTVTLSETYSQIHALGLDDWASVVWEAIPFSFVVDWLIPVGNFLREFGFFRGLTMSHTKTVLKKTYFDYASYVWNYGYYTMGADPKWRPGKWSGNSWSMQRTVGGAVDVPKPSFKALEKALSMPHFLNAAALIHQLASAEQAQLVKQGLRS